MSCVCVQCVMNMCLRGVCVVNVVFGGYVYIRCVMWCKWHCGIKSLCVLCMSVLCDVCMYSDLPCSVIPRSLCAESKKSLSCCAVIAGGFFSFLWAVYVYLLDDCASFLSMRPTGLRVPCVESLDSEMSEVFGIS